MLESRVLGRDHVYLPAVPTTYNIIWKRKRYYIVVRLFDVKEIIQYPSIHK